MTRNPASMRVLIAGSLTRDLIHVGELDLRVPGGSPVHAGRIYAALGAHVTVVFASRPEDARRLADSLPAGFDIRHQPDQWTCTFENRYDRAGRRTQRVLARSEPLRRPKDLDLDRFDVIHLSPLHHDDLAPGWFDILHPNLGLDVQGLVRSIRRRAVAAEPAPCTRGALTRARFVKASVREWACLSGDLGLTPSDVLAFSQALLVTDGARGGRWIEQHAEGTWQVDPARVAAITDPTGAGDQFFAAYLLHRTSGASSDEAVSQAARQTANALEAR